MTTRSTVRATAAAADTQYSVDLPSLVLRIRARGLNNIPLTVSLVDGEVASGHGIQVGAGATWDSGMIRYDGGVIYFAAGQPDGRVEFEIYLEPGVTADDSPYDYGFDLSYES